MNLNFFILGSYNLFVWPAFIFTLILCITLYLKTKKELKIQEKAFLKEFKQISINKIEVSGKRVGIKEIHSPNLI